MPIGGSTIFIEQWAAAQKTGQNCTSEDSEMEWVRDANPRRSGRDATASDRGNAFGGAGLPVLSQLKRKLQSDLPDTRIAGAGNKSEATSRINRPIGILELGVIENVEEFSPKFKIHALVNRRVLVKSDVPIVQSGAVEKSSIGVAYLPNGLREKRGGVKPLISRLPRIGRCVPFRRCS